MCSGAFLNHLTLTCIVIGVRLSYPLVHHYADVDHVDMMTQLALMHCVHILVTAVMPPGGFHVVVNKGWHGH